MKNAGQCWGNIIYLDIVIVQPLMEFAVDDQDYKKNEHGDYRNRYNPICSHPAPKSAQNSSDRSGGVKGMKLPTRHPPKRLHTAIHIPLTLQHRRPRMLNRLPLYLQIRQRSPSNILRLIRHPLTVPQPLTAPVQPIRSAQQLLALLELVICGRVVGVAGAEEGGAVVGEGFELAFCGVDVGFEVAEAGIYTRAGCGGDVLFFDAHHVELWGY